MKQLAFGGLLLLTLVWAPVAWGQPAVLVVNRSLQDNEFKYGEVTLTRGQITILADGTRPTQGVVGLGSRSKLTPDAAANTAGAFIVTQNNTCIEPCVEFVSLFGNHGVPDHPSGHPVVETADAIVLSGDAAIVRHNQIFDFEGVAVRVAPHAGEFSSQRRVARISHNNISHCNSGIENYAVDTSISDNTVANVATYGIRELAGAAQLQGNHVFGAATSISFEGGASRSTNDKASDATTGFNVASNAAYSAIHGLTSVHCGQRNVHVQGTDVTITGSYIEPANTADGVGIDYDGAGSLPNKIVGVHVVNERCSITDTLIHLNDYTLNFAKDNPRSSVGIVLAANNQTIKNVRLEGTSRADEKGIVILPDVQGLDLSVTTAGGNSDFDGRNAAIVWFCDDTGTPTKDWSGTVDVIYDNYDFDAGPGVDIPIRIPAGWTSALTIRIRQSTDDTWTTLTTGRAYP